MAFFGKKKIYLWKNIHKNDASAVMKLLEILFLLSLKEHKRFYKFLLSPFFNDGYNAVAIVQLYEYLREYKFDVNSPELTRERIFKHIFGEKDMLRHKLDLDRLLSELLDLVEQYLTFEQNPVTEMRWRKALSMAKFYRKHGLVKRFETAIEATKKEINKNSFQDSQFFYQKFLQAQEEFEFQSAFNIRRDDANLLETHRNLDIFYSLLKMNYSSILLLQGTLTEIEAKETLLFVETIKQHLERGSYLMTPVMDIYYRIHLLLQDVSDEAAILELEMLIQKNESLVPPDKMKDIQAFYRSFWVKRYVNHNTPDALRDLFRVYEKHLAKGYLYRDGKIHTSTLQSLTNTGLKLKKYEWVRKLLENHKSDVIVGRDDSVEIHNFLLANYYFCIVEYEKVEEILATLKFKDIFYDIQVYFLNIKIYYEQNSPLLDDKINALKVKVARGNLPEPKKAFFYNSLNKLTIIQKLRYVPDRPLKMKVIEELKSSKIFCEREWLIEKVSVV